jgi:predicted nucleotidyltransferase
MHDPFRAATQEFLERLLAHYGERLLAAYLAGSVARGEAAPGLSDINLICLLQRAPEDGEAEEAWRWETSRSLEEKHPALARPDPDTLFTVIPLLPEELSPEEPPTEPSDAVLELQWGGQRLWGEEVRDRMPACPPPRVPNARAWMTRASVVLATAEECVSEHPRLAGHRAAKAALSCCLATGVAEGFSGFTLGSAVIAERFAARHPEWAEWAQEFARSFRDPPTDPQDLAALLEAARVLVDWTATILYAIGRSHNLRV